ncbi:MAG: hypothetical protein VXY87_05295 [Pseudomonadota bacterium]|jgi:hypothetical protein|nr:hypothetical protein [Gammaproteobacteria bacterium]MBT23177.1 hypothetical protein [Gammaproteobacteria bacterium]MEC8466685.1 hypothetical protein [Pseudomonadota bacterium]URQ71686.1 hypothetical protein M9C84_04080 [SAR86 cluster bacterium]|tara:strand:+ start:729 stop:962 length:234 start_codon:yes stop_codon:yes gene_type:complete
MKRFQERGIECLDLHGVRHHEVEEVVLDFCLSQQNFIPLKIICGNSKKMIDLCEKSLNNSEITYQMQRYGIILITKI